MKLLVRADASVPIGTGHVMRCLALAQACQDAGIEAIFALAESTDAIDERLHVEHILTLRVAGPQGSQADMNQTSALLDRYDASWVVVDGYGFNSGYLKSLRSSDARVLLIDDNGRSGRYTADLILNQNVHASEELYRDRESYTRLLLGTKYALLRREFHSAQQDTVRIASECRNILVTMGGSDPDNVTVRVLRALNDVAIRGLELTVIIGGSSPHTASVAGEISRSKHKCRMLTNVTNMRDVIAGADIVISAAGTVCWEYCALGVPAIILTVADNQIAVAEALQNAGAARLIRGGSRFSPSDLVETVIEVADSVQERKKLSETARSLVDARGAQRVAAILKAQCTSDTESAP